MKWLKVQVPDQMTREVAEFQLNLRSWFLIKPTLTKPMICTSGETRKNCKFCEEPECDLGEGWKQPEIGTEWKCPNCSAKWKIRKRFKPTHCPRCKRRLPKNVRASFAEKLPQPKKEKTCQE